MKKRILFSVRYRFALLIVALVLSTLYFSVFFKVGLTQSQNQPPTASADSYDTHGDFETPTVGLPPYGVLINDNDPDNDPLEAISTQQTTGLGVATIYTNGKAAFQPTYGAGTGSVSIPYTVIDNNGGQDSSTVTFNVQNQTPNAVSDTYTVHHSFDTASSEFPGVLENDSDSDGDPIKVTPAVTGLSTPVGTVTINDTGRVIFSTIYGVTGSATVGYTVCDNLGACASSTVTFNVVNQDPLPFFDYYEVIKNGYTTPHVDPPYGVLKNDIDADLDFPLSASYEVHNYWHGQAYVLIHGVAGYVREFGTNFAGSVSFPYTATDTLGGTGVGFVTFLIHPQDGMENAGMSCPVVGQPVNVTNGNMWLQQTDYSLAGIGEPLEINRFYNSIVQHSGLFGFGWSTKYDETIVEYDDGMLRLNMPDSRAIYFGRANIADPFVAVSPGVYGQIIKNVDNTYTLIFKDGRVHHFSATGRLLWQKDRNNNQTTLNYDTNGNLVSVVDAFGRTLTITPNGNGNVASISDSLGTVATYDYYPGTSLLKEIIYQDGSKRKFDYTTINNKTYLTTVKDALDNILETHQYDSQGRATTSEKQGGVEKYTFDYSNPDHTIVTDASNRVTKYYFDTTQSKNVVTKTEGNCNCGGGSEVTTYQYDDKLNIKKKIEAFGDALQRESTYQYDTQGNLLSMADIYGTESYTYNQFGQPLTRTDRMGEIWTNTYDANGNLKTLKDPLDNTTTIEYPATNNKGLPDSIKDARNNITKFKWFTASGLLQEIEDPYGKKTNITYDARGRTKTVANALSHVTTYNYFDDTQRKVEMIYPNAEKITYKYDVRKLIESVTDERGKITTYEFDSAYRLKKITDPLNHTREYGYDPMSNPTSVKDPLGKTTNYEYDDFDRLKKVIYPSATTGATRLETEFEYDKLGRIKKYFDTDNRVTQYGYDDINRIQTVTNPELETTQIKYDQRFQNVEVTDALSQVYQFNYDEIGRLTSQTRAGGTMSYEYDAVGNLKKRTDYEGKITDYTYDNLNRLTKILYDNGENNPTPKQQSNYTYDDISRLKTAVNEAGTVSLNYDNRNRVTSTTDVFGHTVAYEYQLSPTVNQTRLKFNGALYATYNFDDADRLTNIVNASDSTTISFGYDNENKLTSRVLPNGITTTYEYDDIDRLTRLKDASSTATLFDRQYGYNTASQISSITEPTNSRTFGYDFADRLTTVTASSSQNESYNYDDVGNRTSTHLSNTYGYQAFNKLASTQTATYRYNANGNMVSKSEDKDLWQYTWDSENRLTSASTRKQTVRYKYDALGRRVQRHTKGSKENTKFIYDGQDVLVDDDGGTLTKYQNGLGIDDKLSVQTGSSKNYFLADHLGSTNGLADNSGNLTSSASYDSYGNATGNLNTRYQFTGREYDSFTNLHYYRARFYDGKLGRFISEDPIGLNGGINQFAYINNSPLAGTDSMGLDPEYDEQLWRAQQDLIDALMPAIEFGVGFGDNVLAGGSRYFRQWQGIDDPNLDCSTAYQAGEWTGFAVDLALGGAGLFKAGGKAALRKGGKSLVDDAGRLCLKCFEAGTEVQTESGLKPIEEIEAGDKVLSYNEQTGFLEYREVLQKFTRYADDIYSLRVEGEIRPLGVTSEHPFFVRVHGSRSDTSDGDNGEWRETREIKVGDEIKLANGSWAKVLEIKFKGEGQVYNFEVEGNHNYFVGDLRLLTHNAGCGDVGEYLAKKAPKQVTPGTATLEGQYVNDFGRVERWKAYYDQYGRQVARTDFNAGNKAAGIPDVHHVIYEYNQQFPLGRMAKNHIPGEFIP